MPVTEKEITIAAKLYDARRTVRRFHREKWREKLEPARELVQRYMDRKECDALIAATRICQHIQRTYPGQYGHDQLLIMAAAVEIIEPTEDTQNVHG